MSIWIKWTDEQHKLWASWVASRPQVIQDMIAKYDLRYDRLYRLKTTDQLVTLASFNENGTLSVSVLQKFNPQTVLAPFMELNVFGIDPADLEEADWDGEVEDGAKYMENSDG